MKRKLSGKQWLSIVVLTIGCVIQKMDVNGEVTKEPAVPMNDHENLTKLDKLIKVLSLGSDILLILLR